MYHFSEKSESNLSFCHKDLRIIFNTVIKHYDCSVICGPRSKKEQNELFDKGKTKLRFPESGHNIAGSRVLSMAADVVPFPVRWGDNDGFNHFGGYVTGIAKTLLGQGLITHKLRWGGDWNMNNNLRDQSFYDLPHFELVE